MSIKKMVRRYRIDQEPNDFSYWITKTPQERIDALETIRSEYHAWRYSDAEQRFHRVYRIVKQKQSDIKNKKSTRRSQDQADLEKSNKTTLEAMDDTLHNRNMSKSFDSIDALIDDLHSETLNTMFIHLIEEVNMTHNPVFITGKKGNAVLISEKDFNAMQETLFLCSTPSMQDKLLAGMNTPLEECEEWIDGEE